MRYNKANGGKGDDNRGMRMHLKRLQIAGFKSFAHTTHLEFEPGITAIVGPNGSGKSNIADAIRWALGEGSNRNLRHKKNEDLVFAGTLSKARASLAEVKLLLDNSDNTLSLDASEVELSRILYRSGETEYRLNGRKVPVREVTGLLTAAGFGLNSYTIIGQGVIDSFILATPTERKLLFEEASGIRSDELKREQAVRQLEATEANLVRAQDILRELEPRLGTLASAAEAVARKTELTAELQTTREQYFGLVIGQSRKQQTALTETITQLKTQLQSQRQELTTLEEARRQLEASERNQTRERAAITKKLQHLELERDRRLSSTLGS